MAYSTTYPPMLMIPKIGTRGPNFWSYESVDDDATVNGAGYITNGVSLGMAVGDLVFVYDTATPKGSLHYVASASGDAVTLAFAAVA